MDPNIKRKAKEVAWSILIVAAPLLVLFAALVIWDPQPRAGWINSCARKAVIAGSEAMDAFRRCGQAWEMRL